MPVRPRRFSHLRLPRAAVWTAALALAALAVGALSLLGAPTGATFHFVLLGDRTGGVQKGVFEQVWRETAAEHPAFVVSAGDTIEGLHDATAAAEWQHVMKLLAPYRRIPLHLTPGNHDVWSPLSAALYTKYAHHPLDYSFDYGQLHVTVLDNSRTEALAPAELRYLEQDLRMHASQPIKMVVSHRPSWLLPAVFQNPDFRLQQLATRYGVHYVVAGHIHQMLRVNLGGVLYLSLPSAGGHLRASKRYKDGWFFGHTLVDVSGNSLTFSIKETGAPYGKGRISQPRDWGTAGLEKR